MMKKLIKIPVLALLAIGVMALSSCNDDDDPDIMPDAGTISGGPFSFIVDGVVDNVSGITLNDANVSGTNGGWVITDDTGLILGLPPTLEAVEGVNFDDAGAGICLIWYIRYENGLKGLEVGQNANNLDGLFDLSNSITVTRDALNAGVISGGPFTFVVNGIADNVSGITVDDANAVGTNSTWVITDDANNILGTPPTLADLEGVNFDGAGPGVCFIWYMKYQEGLQGLMVGTNTDDLDGSFALSNSISVTRQALSGGMLSGGPFTFTVNGAADNVSGIALDDAEVNGTKTTYVITDDAGNILGLPPTLADVEGVDFDGAGAGVCLIWHLTYEEDLQGLAMGMNTDDLDGFYALSNSISVTREGLNGGTLSGGPFTFTVDGTADNVSGITLDDAEVNGTKNTYVITDDKGNILGLPPTLADVEGVNFDGAGAGICLIWHMTYEDGLMGLAMGMNTDDLDGFYALSNSIMVTRNN